MVERTTPLSSPESIRIQRAACGCPGPCGCVVLSSEQAGIQATTVQGATEEPRRRGPSQVHASPPTAHSPFIEQRPTLLHRLLDMRKIWVYLVLMAALIAAALLFNDRASAHSKPIPISSCQVIWNSLPPGRRFPAKQRCIHRVIAHNCKHVPRYVPGFVRVKGRRVDSGQRHVLGWIVSEGLRRKSHRVVVLAAIVAATQESSARELSGGDGSSAGPFQLIDSHGSLADRITVEFSGNWFFNGAEGEWYSGIRAPKLAQEVEASGYPSAYNQWLPEARRTLPAILGNCRLRS